MSEEIKTGYAKFPNWLMDLVQKKRISISDAHFWVVINNSPPGYRPRRAALINRGYSKRQVDQAIESLLALNLIREIKENIRHVKYEAIDLTERYPNSGQSLSQFGTIVVPIRDTNKTISKNINNGENSPEEITHPASYRRSININHLFVPGKRRDRLEDSAYRLLGGFLPEFWEWLESTAMSNKAMLPLRLNQKIHQSTLQAALTFLDQRAQDKII